MLGFEYKVMLEKEKDYPRREYSNMESHCPREKEMAMSWISSLKEH